MLQNKSRWPLYTLYSGWFLWVLTLVGGCTAHYPVNDRIHQAEPKSGYYVDDPRATRRSDSLLVVLAFSGGGTRAAAFSYGVLEKLARTEIIWDGRPRRLLDEVDLISSVSGGSFTAAYYGLFGDRIFEDFEEKFLKQDVQSALIALLSSPTSWPNLWSSRYNRSELAADLYDEILFEGKTLGDIQMRAGPFVVINATDIELGSRFAFDQRQFDLICSDAARFPVSRAVAASAAVPICSARSPSGTTREPVATDYPSGRCKRSRHAMSPPAATSSPCAIAPTSMGRRGLSFTSWTAASATTSGSVRSWIWSPCRWCLERAQGARASRDPPRGVHRGKCPDGNKR